jgi:hypothetical protein
MPASPPEAFVTRLGSCASIAFALLCTHGLASQASAQAPAAPLYTPAAAKPNELDAFMEKVLKRREVNRQTLEQYVLDESEQFEVLGPARMPVYRQKREFTWYVRDGLHVRSPVRFDGVTVGDDARKEYEDTWVRRERRRLERKDAKDKGEKADTPDPDPVVTTDDPASPGGATPVPTPRFVSEAYFMEFKFEPSSSTASRCSGSSTTRRGCSTTTTARETHHARASGSVSNPTATVSWSNGSSVR